MAPSIDLRNKFWGSVTEKDHFLMKWETISFSIITPHDSVT